MAIIIQNSSVSFLLAAVLLALLCVAVVQAVYNAFYGPLSSIPGPTIRKFSIIPRVWAMLRGQQHRDLLKLHQKYGPFVRYGPNDVALGSGKSAWQEIYGHRKGGTFPRELKANHPINGVNNVATSSGKEHQRHRKVFASAFSERALRQQEPMLKRHAFKMHDRLQHYAVNNQPVDLLAWYHFATFDIMSELTFGEPIGMLDTRTYDPWVTDIIDGVKSMVSLTAIKYLGALQTYVVQDILWNLPIVKNKVLAHKRYSSKRIDARMKQGATKPDIWSLIDIGGRDVLSHAEIHANGNVFMIGGTETIATALAGMTYYLCKNPDMMQRLQDEIRQAFKVTDDLTFEALTRLPFLNAVLNETMRIYPPVTADAPRTIPKEGAVVDGVFLPGGVTISAGHYSTYRWEHHFRHPDEFHPERWLGDAEFKDDHLDAFEPFSVGACDCIGRTLALHEIRLIMATMLLHYNITLTDACVDWAKGQLAYLFWQKPPLWCNLSLAMP